MLACDRIRLFKGSPESLAVGFQRLSHQAVMIELSFTAHDDQASLGKYFQMLRAGCLGDGEAFGEFTAATFSC